MKHTIHLSNYKAENINSRSHYYFHFIALYKEQYNNNEIIWKCALDAELQDRPAPCSNCRESSCSYINIAVDAGKSLSNICIGFMMVDNSAPDLDVLINTLRAFEKRYGWKKTVIIKPEIVVDGKSKVNKDIFILDSSSKWLTNSVTASIFMLIIRTCMTSALYKGVNAYKDVLAVHQELSKKYISNNSKKLIYNGRINRWENLNIAQGDIYHVTCTWPLWDCLLKNLNKVLKDKNRRLSGGYGIYYLMNQLFTTNDRLLKDTIEVFDCNLLRAAVKKNKYIEYRRAT